jgi:hypothetical protein
MQGPSSLPYYQPSDIVVCAPVRRQSTRNESLQLNRSAVKNMPLEDAYRELLQNMCDAMVEVNGHQFNGIKITQYATPGGGRVTVFHTDAHILGEIVQTQTRVSFVNMGPHIESLSQIIQTGASKKDEIPNQAGQHGEGLKRSALKLLTHGYMIDVWFPLCISNDDLAEDDEDDNGDAFRTETRHLTFTLHSKLRCLAYTLTTYRPTERFKGAGDFHRFQVDVSAGDKVPVFDLCHYMLPEALIKDPTVGAVDGYVFFKDARRNSVYVWHFYVVSYGNLFYSYDMFMPRIARDRNDVPYQKLCEYVAKIWSAATTVEEAAAERFYNDILMKGDIPTNTIEVLSLPLFSKSAAQRLYTLFQTKNFPPRRPVKAADWQKLNEQFDQSFFTIVPPHAMVVFDMVLPSLDVYLSNIVGEFTSQRDDNDVIRLSPPPLGPRQLRVVHRPQCPVKYASVIVEDQIIILINLPYDNWESFWNIVLFDYLPKIYGSFGEYFNGMRIASELIEQQEKAPPTFIVYADDEEEQGNTTAAAAVLPSNKRSVPVLPEGFEFYSGPPLIVKKQK